MEVKREYLYIILILFVIGYLSTYFNDKNDYISGGATQVDAPSSAQVISYYAVEASTQLGQKPAIIWSNINPPILTDLPSDANSAGINFPSGSPTWGVPATAYGVKVSTDSNVLGVTFCIKADGPLQSGINSIPIGNYKWDSNVDPGNPGNPGPGPILGNAVGMSTTFIQADTSIGPGFVDYFRFWLTVPAGQAAGTYTNQVTFKGVVPPNVC